MGRKSLNLYFKRMSRAGIILLALALVITACGSPSPTPDNGAGAGTIVQPGPTVTPPFRAIAPTNTPESLALIPTPTAVIPRQTTAALATATPANASLPNYTLPPNYGNVPFPTYGPDYSQVITNGSQIIYVQGGNLWSIDDGGVNVRQLTNGGDINTVGTTAPDLIWTANGDKVAYVNQKNELVIVSIGSGAPPPLFFKPAVANLNPAQPAWSPDGRSLAFTLKPVDLAANFAGEIWLVELQGSKPNLQRIDNGFNPVWSPDGRFLAYLSRTGEGDSAEAVTVATPTPTRIAGPTPFGTSLLPPTQPPTAAPPRLDNNALLVYTPAIKKSRRLFFTSELGTYPNLENQRNEEIKNSTLTGLWWSGDSKWIAFADRSSYVGVVAAGGGTPTLWAGLPDSFAVRQVIWLPNNTGVLFSWNNPRSDDRTFLAQISGLGIPPRTGEAHPDPMSSKGRISILPSEWVTCPALSPAGDLLAYADPKLQAMLVVRLDWSVYSLMPGANCPTWSTDARYLATTLRNADNMIATLAPDLTNLRPFSQTRGAAGLYWQRPELLSADPTRLLPVPANTPVPGYSYVKPDKISPPPDGGGLYAPTAAPAPKTLKPATPTPKK